MKKLIALLLVLVMIVSLVPMSTSAIEITLGPGIELSPDFNLTINGEKQDVTIKNENGEPNTGAGASGEAEPNNNNDDDGEVSLPHGAGDKIIGYGSDTKYHWKQCSCGCKIGMERHVDPKDATNDYCICGYHFSSNADLVTLWVKGCPGIKYFDKNKTEYELDAYTYKDVKEIKISTRTHDSEATVELPEDLTLKEGQNKFEVKVTSENQKVTKVYTLIINKEAKK